MAAEGAPKGAKETPVARRSAPSSSLNTDSEFIGGRTEMSVEAKQDILSPCSNPPS